MEESCAKPGRCPTTESAAAPAAAPRKRRLLLESIVASLPAAGLKCALLRHDQLTRTRRYAEAPFATNWGPAAACWPTVRVFIDRHLGQWYLGSAGAAKMSLAQSRAPTRSAGRAGGTPASRPACSRRGRRRRRRRRFRRGLVLGKGKTILIFSGFGTAAQGATFTSLGHDQWQIFTRLDAHNETITLGNGASIHATDFFFV